MNAVDYFIVHRCLRALKLAKQKVEKHENGISYIQNMYLTTLTAYSAINAVKAIFGRFLLH